MKDILPTVRPLPYFTIHNSGEEKQLAAALRREFVPKISRRLPGHHLRGFSHDFIPLFVGKHKKQYPFFLRMDIARFYPNIRHRELVVGVQIAYRELLGLDYVTSAFKKRLVSIHVFSLHTDFPPQNILPYKKQVFISHLSPFLL